MGVIHGHLVGWFATLRTQKEKTRSLRTAQAHHVAVLLRYLAAVSLPCNLAQYRVTLCGTVYSTTMVDTLYATLQRLSCYLAASTRVCTATITSAPLHAAMACLYYRAASARRCSHFNAVGHKPVAYGAPATISTQLNQMVRSDTCPTLPAKAVLWDTPAAVA